MSKLIDVEDLQYYMNQVKRDIPKRTSDLSNDSDYVSFSNLPLLTDYKLLKENSELVVSIEGKEYRITLLQLLQYIKENKLLGGVYNGPYTLRYEDENGIIENFDVIDNNYILIS